MLLGISKLIGDQKERCIQLCRLFPENYEFFKDVTIQLWEAEFFMDRESAESVFKELELSNDFLFSRIDHSTQQPMYKLATIIHDNENLRIYDINSSIPEDILHMSLPDSLSPAIFKTLHQATKLLTLFILHDPPSQINKIPHHLFLNLPSLRELDMSRTNITDLPSSIGNLENLRYLNLSWTPIRILPNSLCNLIHLITLKLRGCSKLLGLPKDITKLKLLKYLDVDAACLLASMPPGIGNLTCLQSLPVFVVGKDDGYHISELKHMVNLCGTLRILRLEDISCVKECQEAALNQKQYLSKLEFHWTDSQNGYDILENLQPHRNLLDLKIVGYGDVAFPIWISNPLCSHLTAITIDDCSNCEHLPPLGNLQYLKFLCISNMDAVKVIEHQFYSRNMDGKAFPSLENFTLSGMSMLENWGGMEEGDFRHLKQLNISDCPVITAVPELPFLLSLQQLEISFCPLLKSFGNRRLPPSLEYLSIIDCPLLRNRCDKKDGEIWQKLAHVPIIRLDNQEISQERPSPAIPVSTLPLDIVNATVSTSSTNNRDKRKDVMYGDVESTSMSPSGSAEDLERPSPAIPVSPLPFDILNATVSTSSTNNRDKGKDVMYGDVESTSMSPSGSADLVPSPFLSQHFDATLSKQSTSNMDQEKDVMDVVDCRPMPSDVEENLDLPISRGLVSVPRALEVHSVVSAPVTEVGKSIFGAIRRQVRYVTKYKENVSILEMMEEKLDAKRGDLQLLVNEAQRGLKVISPEVINWFKAEANIQDRLIDLRKKLDANKKSIRARRKLSIQSLKMVTKVRDLCDTPFSVIEVDQPQPAVLVNRTSSTKVNIPSRELIMEEVMKELEDGTISSIGVHGMGGIGKTTLMNSVNNKLQESQLFKKVIMVTVSREPDVKVLQDRIAERLDLRLSKNSAPSVRANKLFGRLKAEESVLIILDDIWERLDMLAIGVPSRNDHPGCKVLLTTRDLNVCRQMQVQKTIEVEILSDEESWMVFEEKVGDAVNIPNLHLIGKEIVRRCNGSPLAVAVLGSALRYKAEYEWSYALRVLQNPNATDLAGIMPEVVESVRLSFDDLPSPNVKLCFLYCCMFAEDENILLSELRNYGIGDGFLSMTATIEDATNELLYFVKILKDRGLLLDNDDLLEMSFKMRDTVRDVAMLIASERNYGFFVSAGVGLNYQALPESSSAYKRISVMQNKEYVLSNLLGYPKLRTLIITYESECKYEPGDDFFLGCPALRVLVMHDPPFVPKSISQLTNLRTLYLPNCDLRNRVYLLGGLTKLEVLILHKSSLGELVEEFGNLRNLRVLDLDHAEIDYIEPEIFSRLSKLEELRMWNAFDKWGSVGPEGKPNAGFLEVATLVHLSILNITAEAIEEKAMSNLHWLNKLKEFCVSLNSRYKGFRWRENVVHIRKANLGNHGNTMFFANSMKKVSVRLTECYGFKSFTRFEGFSQLSFLEVEMCDEIEYLIDGGFSNNSFESLEELILFKLRGMTNIMRGETSSTSLGRLRVIRVNKCPNITTLFPASLLFPKARLENLEDVHVENCALLQNIFNTEGGKGPSGGPESYSHGASPGEGLLSGIRSISLSDLPEMTSIWKGVVPSGSLQGLTVLSVSKCHSLIYLLSSDMVRCLQNMEKIYVDDCSKMEKLIQFTCEEAEETACLGKLRCIRITDCPNIMPSHLLFLEERHKSHELEVVGNDALKHIYNEIPWSYQFPSIKITFESFFLLEEGLRSDNSSLQLTATTQFKEMHMIGWDESTIEEVINSGVLSRFVDFVFRDDFPELQFEAVSLLANLVSGTSDFIKVLIDHGVVPIFVNLLSSRSDGIKEQALWALGNIAGGSSDWRDLILEYGTLTPLLVQLNDHTKISILRKAMSALHKIFICKPQPPFEKMKKVLPALVRLIHSNDETVYTDACWVLFYLFNGVGDDIQILIEADVVPGLVRLLQHPHPSVLVPALWTIADIICKDYMQIQCILDHQVLPYLLNVLTEFNYKGSIQKAIFSIVSCITAGSENQIQAVITANIIGLLIQQSKTAEFDIKKEAVWAITNAICGGSYEQIKNLVSVGCITPICDLLVCPDTRLVVACLQAIDKTLKVGKTELPIANDGVFNICMYLTGDCGGLDKIKNLRGHEITEIREKAVNILKIYWPQEGALPHDDKFAQADLQYGENELPVPSRLLNEASRPSSPLEAVKDFEGGIEENQCEEWKMGNVDSSKSLSEEVTIDFWSIAYAKELVRRMKEGESEKDTTLYEIASNNSSSEDFTLDSWSNSSKTSASDWDSEDSDFELGSTKYY